MQKFHFDARVLHPSVVYKRDTQTFVVVHVEDVLRVGQWEEIELLGDSPKNVYDLKNTRGPEGGGRSRWNI